MLIRPAADPFEREDVVEIVSPLTEVTKDRVLKIDIGQFQFVPNVRPHLARYWYPR